MELPTLTTPDTATNCPDILTLLFTESSTRYPTLPDTEITGSVAIVKEFPTLTIPETATT